MTVLKVSRLAGALGAEVRDLDLASITTIHGFCQRVLREHALLAGQPLLPTAIEPDNAPQRSPLAVVFWRSHSPPAGSPGAHPDSPAGGALGPRVATA